MLITGGNLTVSGQRNYANNNVEVFSPKTNTLTALGTMNFPRWYASQTTLRNGNKLVLGGLFSWDGLTSLSMEPTPEVFHPATGTWRKLPGISTTDPDGDWYYPRGFVGFDGAVYSSSFERKYIQAHHRRRGDHPGYGIAVGRGGMVVSISDVFPFSVLTVRSNKLVQVVDLSSSTPGLNSPCSTPPCYLNYDRLWGNATVLADGRLRNRKPDLRRVRK